MEVMSMDYETVLAQLKAYKAIMNNPDADRVEFMQAGASYNDLLTKGITAKGYTFLAGNATRELTDEDNARIIVGYANGADLSKIVPLTPQAELAYQIKRHRQENNMTQADVAKAVGMTQGQIANIENAQADTPFSRAKRLLDVVGGKMTLA